MEGEKSPFLVVRGRKSQLKSDVEKTFSRRDAKENKLRERIFDEDFWMHPCIYIRRKIGPLTLIGEIPLSPTFFFVIVT